MIRNERGGLPDVDAERSGPAQGVEQTTPAGGQHALARPALVAEGRSSQEAWFAPMARPGGSSLRLVLSP